LRGKSSLNHHSKSAQKQDPLNKYLISAMRKEMDFKILEEEEDDQQCFSSNQHAQMREGTDTASRAVNDNGSN
jgi:hypothetical protein